MSELQSSLPLIDLPNGAQIVLEAIDAATGAQVIGVKVANVAITYSADTTPEAPVSLAPLFTSNKQPSV